jgi:hypothetical protein
VRSTFKVTSRPESPPVVEDVTYTSLPGEAIGLSLYDALKRFDEADLLSIVRRDDSSFLFTFKGKAKVVSGEDEVITYFEDCPGVLGLIDRFFAKWKESGSPINNHIIWKIERLPAR